MAARCGADLRVSALAADTPAAQRDALLHAGQLVVATPGQVAQVRFHTEYLAPNSSKLPLHASQLTSSPASCTPVAQDMALPLNPNI